MNLRDDRELAFNEATYVDDVHMAGRVVGETSHSNPRFACKQRKVNRNRFCNQANDCKYRDVSATPGP